MLVYVNGEFIGMFDLDSVRRRNDPKRVGNLSEPPAGQPQHLGHLAQRTLS